ncbi:MAG: RluA family pseudouridine synthase, partial [Desulfuromonadales bacterium]|nr:RluA family pseudouridine synthase [Desulfuromonadales bacterium]
MEPVQQLTFPEDRSAERLDSFLAESLPELSRSQIKKMISARQILLDGAPAKASVKLKGGELIVISRPEPEPIEAIPEDLPLKVLYEDA